MVNSDFVPQEKAEVLKKAMEAAGMYFDSFSSSPDGLRFTSEMGNAAYFDSWKDVSDWLEGVVFDDPETVLAVDGILHPEKYKEHIRRDVLAELREKQQEVKAAGRRTHSGRESEQRLA